MSKEVLFFIGSGCSRSSLGGIGAREIEHILLGDYHNLTPELQSDPRVIKVREVSEANHQDAEFQIYLKRLKNIWDDYLAGIKSSYVSGYEDWFSTIDTFMEISHQATPLQYNPILAEFAKQETNWFKEYHHRNPVIDDHYAKMIWQLLLYHIELALKILLKSPYRSGLDVFGDLDANTFDLVTLNHDLLLEDVLLQKGKPFEDGFVVRGDEQEFDFNQLNAAEKTKIVHLHGAIDWLWVSHFDKNESLVKSYDLGIGSGSIGGKQRRRTDRRKNFLTGISKERRYSVGYFGQMMDVFHNLLREHSRIIISGYGWNDRSVNNLLWDWIGAGNNRALLLHSKFYADHDLHCRFPRGNTFSDFETSGRLIIEDYFLQDLEAETIRSFIR